MVEGKFCRTCGEYKSNDQFRRWRARCKKCLSIELAQWKRENKDKVIAQNKKYKASEKGNENARKYRKTDQYIMTQRRIFNRYVNVLADSYIIRIIVRRSMLKAKDIPASLIEVKRLQLMIEREYREKR